MPYDLRQLLIQRLSHRGLEKNQIPGFLRSLANSIDIDKNPNYTIINKHMRNIGWDEIDLACAVQKCYPVALFCV